MPNHGRDNGVLLFCCKRTYVCIKIRTDIRIGVRGMIENFIGHTVQIIYNDRNRNISIREILVRSVRDGRVKAYCFTANAPRIFTIENIIDGVDKATCLMIPLVRY